MIIILLLFAAFILCTVVSIRTAIRLQQSYCYRDIDIKIGKITFVINLDLINFAYTLMSVVLACIICVCVLEICVVHINDKVSINEAQIQYESLLKRIEVINSEYESVSRSDVIKDVAEWNKKVYHEKHYLESPWTNWFHDRDYVESLKYIDLNEVVIDSSRITEEECDVLLEVIRRES